MQLNKILFQLGHDMLKLTGSNHVAAIIMRVKGICFAIPVDAYCQRFIGAAAENLEHIITIGRLFPVKAGSTAVGDSMAAKTFQLLAVFLADYIF